MSRDVRTTKKPPKPPAGGDMGQTSFEESQELGKGPSESKQGPKRVRIKRDRFKQAD
jgi:hypothetical protein